MLEIECSNCNKQVCPPLVIIDVKDQGPLLKKCRDISGFLPTLKENLPS